VDLGKVCRIEAVQVNFAEHESTALAGAAELYHQYRLEGWLDAKTWETLADRSGNRRDVPHDYIQLPAPVNARFVRITNVRMPGGGSFSIRDLRFNAVVRREMLPDAEGYVVRYGIAPGKLYHNLEIRGRKEIVLHDLNAEAGYYFAVDAFNDSGRTLGSPAVAR
jgi:hypothetical protein